MSIRYHTLLLPMATMLMSSAYIPMAKAQSSDNETPEKPYKQLASGGPINAADRIGNGGYQSITPSAQLSNEDGLIAGDFALDISWAGKPKSEKKEGVTRITNTIGNLAIKAKIPLNKSDKDAGINFKNFGNDGSLTVNFNAFRPAIISARNKYPYFVRFAHTCIKLAGDKWVEDTVPPLTRSQKDQIERLLAQFDNDARVDSTGIPVEYTWDDALKGAANKPEFKDFGPVAMTRCHTDNPKIGNEAGVRIFARQTLNDAELREYQRKISKAENTLFFGGEASLGLSRSAVIDRVAFSLDSVSKVGFDVNARFGYFFNEANSSISVAGGFTRSFEFKDEAEVCGPPNGSGQSTCLTGQDGRPVRKETGYGEIRLRQILKRHSNGEPVLAMAPSVTYIIKDKDWQFRLPLFLQRSEKSGLDAGIQAIYVTGKKDFGIGAFIGVPFSSWF